MGQPGLGKLPGKCLGVDEAPGEAEPVSSLFLKLGPSEPFATPQQACLMETATRACSPAYPKWLPDGFGLRRFLLQQILGPIPATLPYQPLCVGGGGSAVDLRGPTSGLGL